MRTCSIIQKEKSEFRHWQRRGEKIKDYISANLAGDLSLATVSQKFELSTSTLKLIFKKYTGNSYHHHVEELRMKKAIKLIILEGQRVQQTMYASGYKYRSSFNKAFKKRFKHSPGYFLK
jgi:AraC-like DNA-binding protein